MTSYKKVKDIKHIIPKNYTYILEKIKTLEQIQLILAEFIPTNIQPFYQVSNIKYHKLILHIASSVFLNQLIRLKPQIISTLQRHQFYHITDIQFKISPHLLKKNQKKSHFLSLSNKSIQELTILAERFKHYPNFHQKIKKLTLKYKKNNEK